MLLSGGLPYFPAMANEGDPPEWNVYQGGDTPKPEPEPESESEPDPDPPPATWVPTPHVQVPYGSPQQLVRVTKTSTAVTIVPKLVLGFVVLIVVGVVGFVALLIFSLARSAGGPLGADPKDPKDFAEMVADIEKKTGRSDVFSVGLYDGYAIVYTPVDGTSKKAIAYRWDGNGISVFTKSTASESRFKLSEIDPAVIEGMCDPIVELADGVSEGECYVQIRKPGPPFGGKAWFTASASDDFNQYYSVSYDLAGNEIERTVPDAG